jgi:hypothetical protein
MARQAVSVQLEEVPLSTRFRKQTTDRKAKVRARAKVEVVQIGDKRFGVTIRRGIVTVKKGTVEAADTTVAKVRAAIQKEVKAGHYDTALFDDYAQIVASKKKLTKKS